MVTVVTDAPVDCTCTLCCPCHHDDQWCMACLKSSNTWHMQSLCCTCPQNVCVGGGVPCVYKWLCVLAESCWLTRRLSGPFVAHIVWGSGLLTRTSGCGYHGHNNKPTRVLTTLPGSPEVLPPWNTVICGAAVAVHPPRYTMMLPTSCGLNRGPRESLLINWIPSSSNTPPPLLSGFWFGIHWAAEVGW